MKTAVLAIDVEIAPSDRRLCHYEDCPFKDHIIVFGAHHFAVGRVFNVAPEYFHLSCLEDQVTAIHHTIED